MLHGNNRKHKFRNLLPNRNMQEFAGEPKSQVTVGLFSFHAWEKERWRTANMRRC